MNIAIYTITSALHDAKAIDAATREFLGSLDIEYEMRGSDFSDYGSHALHLIYIYAREEQRVFSSHCCPNYYGNRNSLSTC